MLKARWFGYFQHILRDSGKKTRRILSDAVRVHFGLTILPHNLDSPTPAKPYHPRFAWHETIIKSIVILPQHREHYLLQVILCNCEFAACVKVNDVCECHAMLIQMHLEAYELKFIETSCLHNLYLCSAQVDVRTRTEIFVRRNCRYIEKFG